MPASSFSRVRFSVLGAQNGKPLPKLAARLVFADLHAVLFQHIPGVQFISGIHRGYPGLLFPVDDGPFNGRSAAVFGQQGAVDIDASQGRQGQHLPGENLPEGHGNQQVGAQLSKRLQALPADLFKLIDGNSLLLCQHLHGGGASLCPRPLGRSGWVQTAAM